MKDISPEAQPDPWQGLRRFTSARIGLGHTGISQRTHDQLAFQLAHARARDAVHEPLDAAALAASLQQAWPGLPGLPAPLVLHSAAPERNVYLQRPDLGRRLDAPSRERLRALRGEPLSVRPCDLAVVLVDGLSGRAVAQHAAPLLQALRPRLDPAWTLAPLCIVEQGRVAVGDEVGELLGARLAVVLIGERPGLSSPDSMGLYITWAPSVGLTDERRNCISNVRPAGLGIEDAARKLHVLLGEAHRRQLTGVQLKDEADGEEALAGGGPRFLL
ncbi:ethanolamine ammonia-lyase subunit EutC [Massilia sp. 9096]|uniref:ethanolamine ammonia-lyase subunit EutC n=1 Tax=Massilia sp. 9096 TaxID=1500894 RepID=UPI00056426C4|nr:ethanolamine ammonia-lyase subunit EutC [Massilia sp. 9096]